MYAKHILRIRKNLFLGRQFFVDEQKANLGMRTDFRFNVKTVKKHFLLVWIVWLGECQVIMQRTFLNTQKHIWVTYFLGMQNKFLLSKANFCFFLLLTKAKVIVDTLEPVPSLSEPVLEVLWIFFNKVYIFVLQ